MGLADIPTDTSYSFKEVYVDPSSRATAFICEHLYDYFRKCGFSNNEWVIPKRCSPLQVHLLEFNYGYKRV